jgi:hypothetical protein
MTQPLSALVCAGRAQPVMCLCVIMQSHDILAVFLFALYQGGHPQFYSAIPHSSILRITKMILQNCGLKNCGYGIADLLN